MNWSQDATSLICMCVSYIAWSELRKLMELWLGSSLELTEIPEDFMNLVKAAGVTAITELDMHRSFPVPLLLNIQLKKYDSGIISMAWAESISLF